MSDKKEYVEREAAVAALCEYCDGGACKDSGNSECAEYRKIRLIPAAAVEEVRHGEWVLKEDGKAHCSQCDTAGMAYAWNYCPSCGAKMDGGRSND